MLQWISLSNNVNRTQVGANGDVTVFPQGIINTSDTRKHFSIVSESQIFGFGKNLICTDVCRAKLVAGHTQGHKATSATHGENTLSNLML